MLKIIQPTSRSEWWSDNSHYPNNDWVLLQVDDQGIISVFDGSDEIHYFDKVRDAEIWLTICGFDKQDSQSGPAEPDKLFCEDMFNELIEGIPTPKLRLVK